MLEQIPQNAATSLLVSIQPNELNATIGRAHGIFREHSPDLIWLIIAGPADVLPDLLCRAGDYAEQRPQRTD
ncbi:hypothetical protein ABIA85_009334 [Bradyrhizobium sp. LA6.10]